MTQFSPTVPSLVEFSRNKSNLREGMTTLGALLFLFVPLYSVHTGDTYMLTLFARVLVFALAAVGLNLALGYGGQVSLGHAMYLGLGAYTVAILSSHGVLNGGLHLLAVAGVTAAIAVPVGLVSLRTKGVSFLMITLAFAQMLFYVFVGLKQYGGDDGLPLTQLSSFGALTGSKPALYLSLLASLAFVLYAFRRVVHSRFGLVLRATRFNEPRVHATGTSALGYRLVGYVISAEVCALAGYFLANLSAFASPAYMSWQVSGELIVMVLLGGAGTLMGPVVGASVFILLEEGLKATTEHWMLIMGPVIVLIVLFLNDGLWGLLKNNARHGKGH